MEGDILQYLSSFVPYAHKLPDVKHGFLWLDLKCDEQKKKNEASLEHFYYLFYETIINIKIFCEIAPHIDGIPRDTHLIDFLLKLKRWKYFSYTLSNESQSSGNYWFFNISFNLVAQKKLFISKAIFFSHLFSLFFHFPKDVGKLYFFLAVEIWYLH